MALRSFFIGFDTSDGFLSFAAATANDRASGLLDSTSIIREDPLPGIRISCPDVRPRPNGCRCAIRFIESRTADRRDILRGRGEGAVGCGVAAAGTDPAEDSAGRRSSDRLSRRHYGPVLR